jgi:hypothetical protein
MLRVARFGDRDLKVASFATHHFIKKHATRNRQLATNYRAIPAELNCRS